MSQGVPQLLVLGMVIQPLIGNPYNGALMSLSPTIGKKWELIDPIAHMEMNEFSMTWDTDSPSYFGAQGPW